MHERPQNSELEELQQDLERIGARCRVSVKREPRGAWQRLPEELSSFNDALRLAESQPENLAEVAIFMVHAKYGGIQIWTNKCPHTVNRFDHFEPES